MMEKNKLQWLGKLNVFYGLIGGLAMLALYPTSVSNGVLLWFYVGWLVSVLNLELIKRIGLRILPVFSSNEDQHVGFSFYVLLIGKFCFWGAVIALLTQVKGVQPIAFVVGSLTIVFSGLSLGVREFLYAPR